MGLGHGFGNGFVDYPLVVDSLATQGLTNTKLFSMDLGKQIKPGGESVFSTFPHDWCGDGLVPRLPSVCVCLLME